MVLLQSYKSMELSVRESFFSNFAFQLP